MNELVGEDLTGCESSYETAIIMLEALLEPLPRDTGNDSEPTERLDDEDRITIEKCICLIHPVLIDSHPKHQETPRRPPQEIGLCISTKFADSVY